mgnify:CR=1 FL=1
MANRFVLNETSYHGAGAIKEVVTEVKARGLKKGLVVTDKDLIKFGVATKVTDLLDEAGLPYEIYDEVKANPTVEQVKNGVQAAKDAGADIVAGKEILEDIKKGWLDFEVMIATPNMMAELGKLGRILGPKGLMPNPKTGTVTMDVAKAVQETKAGKVTYRTDKEGNVHLPIGRVSFDDAKLVENFNTIYDLIVRLKPTSAKGTYIKNIAVSSTMGPAIKVQTTK